MAVYQRYGIKYPFTCNNDENIFLDVNNNEAEYVKSKVLHVIFTPKGQKIRDPEFGTDLVKYIFSPNNSFSLAEIKGEISASVKKYVPEVDFNDINVYRDDNNDSSIIVTIDYKVKIGNKVESTTVGVKL